MGDSMKNKKKPKGNMRYNDIDDIIDIKDIDKKDIKNINNIKNITISIDRYRDFFKNQGNKEYILCHLWDKIKSSSEIDEELNLPKLTSNLIINRYRDFFEIDHKEGKKVFYKISKQGKKFIENAIKEKEKIEKRIEESKSEKDSSSDIIEKWSEFLESYKINLNQEELIIDFQKDLILFNHSLGEELLEEPEENLRVIEKLAEEKFDKKLDIKIRNLPKDCHIRIRDFRAEHLGKLILTDGIIKRKSAVNPILFSSSYECPSCGNRIKIKHELGEFAKSPRRCSCGRKGAFTNLSNEYIDICYINLEEPIFDEKPQNIPLIILRNLAKISSIDKLRIGSYIRAIGIFKEFKKYSKKGLMRANVDVALVLNDFEILDEDDFEIKLSKKEIEKSKEVAKDIEKNRLKKSLCLKSFSPYSIGNEEIREALILQLVCPKNGKSPDGNLQRNKSHLLLFGDTGSNKTKQIQASKNLIPKAQYCTGGSSSGIGLLASVIKDEIQGWSVEAGAIPLANNSICFIDEFDKFNPEDIGKIHEAMSEQKITINKANIHMSIPANSCITIIGNPKSGKFDTFKDLLGQILPKNESPLSFLNRFDLIFFIRDNPDEEKDRKISDSMFLREKGISDKNLLSQNDLRNFIAFINNQSEPEWNKEAENKAKKFYIKFRQLALKNDSKIPINARLIESIQRLANCYARLRLSKSIQKRDIEDAILLLKKSYRSMELDFIEISEEDVK